MTWYNYAGWVGFFGPIFAGVLYLNWINGGLPTLLIGLAIATWFLGSLYLMFRRPR